MGDLIFVAKTLVITVAIVVLMQIKIGPQTIEQRSIAWIHQSPIVEQLQEVAAGAVKAGGKGVSMIKGYLGMKTKSAVSAADKAARDLEIKKIGTDAVAKAKEVTESASEAVTETAEKVAEEIESQ